MINPSNFPDWEFTEIKYDFAWYGEPTKIAHFNFKSPRLLNASHYNPILQEDSDEALRAYEKECYLNQVMWPIAQQIQGLQNDIRRQIQLHINRGLPLPSELKACVDLKIV
jgi:hypothetical protein